MGGLVPTIEPQFLKLAISSGQLGLLEWMRAHCPPCPCDFEVCPELTDEGGTVRAYLQMGLNLLRMCGIGTEDMTATEMADAVALIDQGADLHAKNNDGWTPLYGACEGKAEVVKALLEKGADVHTIHNGG
jgi:hypothetical protein